MQSCKFKITKFGEDKPIRWTESDPLKVSKSQKQIMASWILPKNERWGIFQYIKLPQHSCLEESRTTYFF